MAGFVALTGWKMNTEERGKGIQKKLLSVKPGKMTRILPKNIGQSGWKQVLRQEESSFYIKIVLRHSKISV